MLSCTWYLVLCYSFFCHLSSASSTYQYSARGSQQWWNSNTIMLAQNEIDRYSDCYANRHFIAEISMYPILPLNKNYLEVPECQDDIGQAGYC